jgi:ribosomal protein L10
MPQHMIERIATLPSREVLLAQVCGLLGMQMQRLLWTLQKVAEKKQS